MNSNSTESILRVILVMIVFVIVTYYIVENWSWEWLVENPITFKIEDLK